MGSRKHKKDSKKKKHKSRSLSPFGSEERDRKRHKKHKDRRKDRSPDVEEVPVDSHLPQYQAQAQYSAQVRPDAADSPRSGQTASDDRDKSGDRDRESEYDRERERERDRERDRDRDLEREREREREYEHVREPSPLVAATSAQESLSIEETNRIRVKLGLKPLEVAEKPDDDGKFKDDLGEFYHKPAANITEQQKSEKLRQKLEERKEKRKLEHKLQTRLLAEQSDDEDAVAWVQKSRQVDAQKQEAAKRAALLDEMDEAFGVSALVAADVHSHAHHAYSGRELRGLRVAHDIDAIGEEQETILTLADKEVLAEDNEDILVNVNIVDDERYKKNVAERKKAKSGYQAYDDEADLEAAALGLHKPVLAKYDEEIDRGKAEKRRGFVIGDDDAIEAKRFREMMRQERLQGGVEKRLESLQLPALRLASDYMDEHEMQAKFKKVKKKGKFRKKPKQEPIDVEDYEAGLAPLDTDDTDVKPEVLKEELAVDEEEVEPDNELQLALARARRLRQAERAARPVPKVEEILEQVKEEPSSPGAEVGAGGGMVVDATAEFCRTLGDIPTYGLAGNRDHHAEIMEVEREELEPEGEGETEGGGAGGGAWSRVDVGNEKPPDLAAGTSVGLEAEPALGAGVAGALRLALSKGYLERSGAAPAPRPARPQNADLLTAHHYSIEDKTYGEDDKYGRRERGGHSGPLQDFREKSHFRPTIKLEYVDDEGRPLCPKEAFRYLSHKFHGKGPGKNKQEKRLKKAVQEGLMKKMSSTDTPLGTLQMLQEKQRETHSPYVLLSGQRRDHPT